MKYLIHVDGSLPNLALMRLSTYFKGRGHEVRLVRGEQATQGPGIWDPPGHAYASSIFKFSAERRLRVERAWSDVTWGGTGVYNESNLSQIAGIDWETIKPDYSLYPDEQRSLGFTQRGCRLKCKFCVVPEKEGRPKSVSTISDIWRGEGHAKKILLLDNDFFGQSRSDWQARIEELAEGDFRVCFSQGINIRQVDAECAAALARVQYRDNRFGSRVLYTAWDNLGDKAVFLKGVETLAAAGIPAKHLRVYMLIGYAKGETWDDIHDRFNQLVALGCNPYPMAYDQSRGDLKAFQRWAIRGLYRTIPFADYRDKRKDEASTRAAPGPRHLPVITEEDA